MTGRLDGRQRGDFRTDWLIQLPQHHANFDVVRRQSHRPRTFPSLELGHHRVSMGTGDIVQLERFCNDFRPLYYPTTNRLLPFDT